MHSLWKISNLTLAVFLLASFNEVAASNYYFSTSIGNDSRTSEQAQDEHTPWKTLDKLNSFFSSLNAGDSVLLKREDVFFGSIIISKSGDERKPIVIGSYGKGNNPVITGFKSISSWTLYKDGIYKSEETLNDSALNMVTINDVEYAMGRYPNYQAQGKGWKTISSHTGNSSITDNLIVANLNFDAGELVIRKKHYVIDRNKIVTVTENTIHYLPGSHYEPSDGFGYFIQNHLSTLDQFGEWYYDPFSKKLFVYFGDKAPKTYRVNSSNINSLIASRKFNNISFNNLSLAGSNQRGFYLYYANNISIKNCDIFFSGGNAIEGFNVNNIIVENCEINYSNNNAIDLIGKCNSNTVQNNAIKNTGLFEGMAANTSHSFSGINITGDDNAIRYNRIDSTGYTPIRFDGSSCQVSNNYIDQFCFNKDDGGGILTNNNNGAVPRHDQNVSNNIILNGIGAPAGTNSSFSMANGIYIDDNSANIQVVGNTVAHCGNAGILLHNSHDIRVSDNTFYDNGTQLIMQKDLASTAIIRNSEVSNNILVSKEASQFVASFFTNRQADDIAAFGRIDSNYYWRPIDDSVVISTSYIDNSLGKINKFYNLRAWSSDFGKDVSSKKPSFQLDAFKINQLISANKIFDGNFNNDKLNVTGFKCKVSNVTSGILDGAYLQVTTLPNVTSSYITMPVGKIKSGKIYRMKFTIAGSDDSEKTVSIYLRANGAPYENLAEKIYRSIPRKRRDYEIAFTAIKNEESALLIFALNEANVSYYLDNLQLNEANATITNPEDHLKFVCNPTSQSKKILLNGSYRDVISKVYINSISLAPYSSAILMKAN